MASNEKKKLSETVQDLKASLTQTAQKESVDDLNSSAETLDKILETLNVLSKKIDAAVESDEDEIVADLTVATRMPEELLEQVRDLLEKNLEQNVTLVQIVDPSIIGGLILVVGDERHDISIKSQLERLKKEVNNLPWASLIQEARPDEE